MSGRFPFNGKDINELEDNICSGKLEFPDEHWGSISDSAKDFIKKCLVVDQYERWTTTKLLNHPWISQTRGEAG